MPLINFSGIASGIDTEGLISATSAAARATRVTPSQNKIADLEETNSALESLKSLLRSLQSLTLAFSSTSSGILQKRASSSDETTLTASASGTASNGAYSVTVSTLARGDSLSLGNSGTPYASASTAIASGLGAANDFTITLGSPVADTVEVNITATTTLNDFVTAFNNETTLATASVVNVGTTASPDYRILIKSTKTGTAEGTIAIDAGDMTAIQAGGGFTASTGQVGAANATFSITGISGTITRQTNSIADLIPGVTFNLKATGGPTTITVSDDTSATTAKVQEFIDKYNEVVAFVNENNQIIRQQEGENVSNKFNALSLTRVDDNAVQSIRDKISESRYFNTGDSTTATNAVRIFSELGISTESDPYNAETQTGGGSLEFNSQTFLSALASEPESVSQILQTFGDLVGRQTGVIQEYIGFNKIMDLTINANRDQIDDLNDRIAQAEAAILQQESLMRQRFARLESTIGRMQQQQSALTSALASLNGG